MATEPDDPKAATARLFDELAPAWRGLGLPPEERVRALQAALACPPGSRVLDIGCGAGRAGVALALRGYRVEGLAEESVAFRQGDIEHLGGDPAAFDAVLCWLVLDFVPSPGRVLAECRRVLRPGGRLVVATLGASSPVKREWWRRFLPDHSAPPVGNHILPWETESLLRELGWRIVTQEPFFGPSLAGVANPYGEGSGEQLADPLLAQAVATAWQIVAAKPPA